MLKPFTFNVFIDMVKFASLVLLFFSLFVPSVFIFSSFHNFFWIFLDSIFIIPFHCCLIICISVLFFVINQALQHTSFFFFNIYLFMYLVALGLCCSTWA